MPSNCDRNGAYGHGPLFATYSERVPVRTTTFEGIDVRLETKIADCRLEQNQDGEEVVITLEGGEELRADAVVYGIGIVPNAQLAVEAGLDVDFAIKVNENCQTSNADIYAAGDVATQLRDCGNHRRVETWENANLQAGIFARHVMGIEHPTPNPAWF